MKFAANKISVSVAMIAMFSTSYSALAIGNENVKNVENVLSNLEQAQAESPNIISTDSDTTEKTEQSTPVVEKKDTTEPKEVQNPTQNQVNVEEVLEKESDNIITAEPKPTETQADTQSDANADNEKLAEVKETPSVEQGASKIAKPEAKVAAEPKVEEKVETPAEDVDAIAQKIIEENLVEEKTEAPAVEKEQVAKKEATKEEKPKAEEKVAAKAEKEEQPVAKEKVEAKVAEKAQTEVKAKPAAFDPNNPLDAKIEPAKDFIFYEDFPKILFNPPKPIENPLAVKKLKYIAFKMPLLDGYMRLNVEKMVGKKNILSKNPIWKKEQRALKTQYVLNNYQPIWFHGAAFKKDRAMELIATLKNAENFALNPERYDIAKLESLMSKVDTKLQPTWNAIAEDEAAFKTYTQDQALQEEAQDRATVELALTHAAFAYVRHASAGQLIPSSVDRNMDVRPKATKASLTLSSLKAKGEASLQSWLEDQNPNSEQFNALLSELKEQSKLLGQKVKIINVPGGKALKAGHRSSRVVKLAQRLEQMGYYKHDVTQPYPNRMNDEILSAVLDFQAAKGLKADGIVGSRTVAALNYKKPDYVKKLLINLERQRWLPRDLGYKHVMVNQPEFRLRVVEGDDVTYKTNVVIGKKKFQTPVFYNKISTVVVNPYWNVPNSILFNELRPKMTSDPSFVSRNNYETIGAVNWENATARYVPFRVRQKPGRGNALGQVKFLFPNRHSIYLHDTPSKSLFGRASRAFSHGCIRVQNPNLLALNLMSWSDKQYKGLIKAGKNRHFAMKKKVPVYLTYMTASMDDEGKVRYYKDVYGRDNLVANALNVKQYIARVTSRNMKQNTELSMNDSTVNQ